MNEKQNECMQDQILLGTQFNFFFAANASNPTNIFSLLCNALSYLARTAKRQPILYAHLPDKIAMGK
jgi:hypothetical protein